MGRWRKQQLRGDVSTIYLGQEIGMTNVQLPNIKITMMYQGQDFGMTNGQLPNMMKII